MKIRIKQNWIVIQKDEHDRYIKNESVLFYRLKNTLNNDHGFDLIKKLMTDDGHMVSEGVHYLRSKDWAVMIYDQNYQIRNAAQEFNKGLEVGFTIERDGNG